MKLFLWLIFITRMASSVLELKNSSDVKQQRKLASSCTEINKEIQKIVEKYYDNS